MNPPRIIQFRHGRIIKVKTGPWWNRKIVCQTIYDRFDGEVRDFIGPELHQYFSTHTPKVGDLIYIEGCFRIIRVFFNLNKNSYEIWWVHTPCAESNDIIELDKP